MISMIIRSFGAPMALALVIAAPSFADLFAILAPDNQILRIDSATGNITQTYLIPDFAPVSSSPTAGLAFDGEVLYMTRRIGTFEQLFRYDVTYDFWFPPAFLPTLPNPTGEPQPVSGLGFIPDGFGSGAGTLVATTRNPVGTPPSYIFEYQVFPGFIDTVFPAGENPVGALPPAMDAQGADVDSASGELWIAADELTGQGRVPRLLHTDVTGTVLQTLTPTFDSATVIRGLGFDAGSMFIAGRKLATSTNYIYEIDRGNGAVLRSFVLPGSMNVAALTGGTVLIPVPEPAGFYLMAVASLGLLRRRRWRSTVLSTSWELPC
jgi:hypothetical protein